LIETLCIENVAIVERAELEFGPGLNVLTGETGAGKSIVLGALALLAGGRASGDAIRDGAESAAVEAVFRTEDLPELEAKLGERGLEADEHQLIVQRTVAGGGRGRARVAGQLVPIATLAELFRGRIEVSSQHDSQALLRPEVHGWLLDRTGGLLRLREAVAGGHARLRELDAELGRLRSEAQERARRQDFLTYQVNEIDEAELDPAELRMLDERHGRLAHAERIREEGAATLAALAGDALGDGSRGAADLMAQAARRLAGLAQLDTGLGGLAERVAALASEAGEAALDLERHLDGIEADPGALALVDERLAQIEALKRKYGESVEAVLCFREAAARDLAHIEGADAREAEILGEREACAESLAKDAASLSDGRRKAGRKLAKAVQAALRELAMPQARFEVGLDPVEPPAGTPCGPSGAEAPEFRFSANAGEMLRSFRKVASGGELSRALLAIKGALREHGRGMVLVFDEVDAGVGGRAADRVGRALAELAEHHQVLCITHLPQVAAFADVHLRVEKRTRKGRTLAALARVEGEERVREIARMAGGEKVGEATLTHARELLARRAPPA
jgi:DNA repair protein RecN (Recombination protein N)